MILDDGAGNRLAVRIRWPDGRSPDDPVEEGDWLWVSMDAATPDAGWQVSDVECLMVGDVVDLVRWLRALGEGRRPSDHLSFLEPNLDFSRRWDSPPGKLVLRVGFSQEMDPPAEVARALGWADAEFFINFMLTPEQVSEAAASMERELRGLVAQAGDDGASLWADPVLSESFLANWTFIARAASSGEEAIRTVEAYMDWAGMPIEILGCEAGEQPAGGWLVRGRMMVPAAGDEWGEALYRLLSHIPLPYGFPRISGLNLAPSGWFHCDLFLVPWPHSGPGPFSALCWHCSLTNDAEREEPGYDVRRMLASLAGEREGG